MGIFGPAAWFLGHSNGGEANALRQYCPEAFEYVLCQHFGSLAFLAKIVDATDITACSNIGCNLIERLFQVAEIGDHSLVVQFVGGHFCGGTEIVAVDRLVFAVGHGHRMRGPEETIDVHVIHFGIQPFNFLFFIYQRLKTNDLL